MILQAFTALAHYSRYVFSVLSKVLQFTVTVFQSLSFATFHKVLQIDFRKDSLVQNLGFSQGLAMGNLLM